VREILWRPSEARINASEMKSFMTQLEERFGLTFSGYRELHQWSIDNPELFWDELWFFFDIITSCHYDAVVDDLSKFPGAEWFPGAKLNYAENMLRDRRSDEIAIIFRGENHTRRTLTWRELRDAIERLATTMRGEGIAPGDTVAAYMPNMPETIIAMLAASAIGAVWCSCATDIGPTAAIDRLGQIEPKILFTVDGYTYKGRPFDMTERATEVAAGIPSVGRVVFAHYAGDRDLIREVPNGVGWDEYLAVDAPESFVYEQLPASHPLVVMFSSGTTGKPKCMVQSQAGLLINQLKEIALHHDVTEKDRMLYITTCSWMMWNWMLAALGTGCSLVLFDGNPSYPDTSAIWKILEEEKVTLFGLSASYIHALMAEGFVPKDHADLSHIRNISQTGSALSDAGFKYVYDSIKRDLHFCSIAGGTDINGCFCLGNPLEPVYSNELQCIGLGEPVKAFNGKGETIYDEQGELVCTFPIPSMPIYFWDDADGQKYHDAYFDVFPGAWRHGDYIEIHSDTGGVTFYGRSDSILKPSGVRIGTSEIYAQVQKVDEVQDSLAVGQQYEDDERVILFVQMKEGEVLTADVAKRIRAALRLNASPRHVPKLIMETKDIPKTLNGKIVEGAVTNILHRRKVTNRDALQNPEILDFFESLLPLLEASEAETMASELVF
jgi:acetoacetyl-CoA synthetase